MKKNLFEITYMFAGILIGFLMFFLSHIIYPELFHSESKSVKAHWRPKSIETDLPVGEAGALIKYGYLLVTKTSDQIGPLTDDPNSRYAGNNLSCNNCHLNAGEKLVPVRSWEWQIGSRSSGAEKTKLAHLKSV